MNKNEIRQIIDETVSVTVLKLKAAGLLKDDTKTAYEKTEALLYQYKELRQVQQPYAQRVVQEIDACLEGVKNDPYAKVIELYYFEGLTNTACADMLPQGCDERTARRNRQRLVKAFSVRLASDDFIRELLL